MGKKDTSTDETAGVQAQLTPADIQQKEFRVSRFGGYKMRDVDEFLDRVTDSFTALTHEMERLRTTAATPVVGAPDLDDVARQADEIIARARAEAARITGDAKAAGSASTVSVRAAVSGQGERAVVNAFLSREREFLQSLAGLVQEHAEAVKGMAKSARPAPDRPAAEPTVAAAETRAAPSPSADAAGGTGEAPGSGTTSEMPATPAADARPAEADEPTRVPEPEHTVRIEEPAPAGAPRGDGEPESDRSLRELFWGED